MSFTVCYIKNIDTVNHSIVGKEIVPNEEYQIPDEKRIAAGNNSDILDKISSGKLQIGNGASYYTTTADQINRLKNIDLLEVDEEGRQINRTAYGKKGWTYIGHPFEFTTSKLNSVHSKDWKNADRADYILKFYKSDGTEVTTQSDIDTYCVETRLTIKPDYDYEVIAGTVDIHTAITTDVRMWVVGGVIDSTTNLPWEYPASSGVYHAKEFAGGINFKYIGVDQKIETDGRAAKYMSKTSTGVPFNTNQFQVIIRHPVGEKHDFMLTLEYFRA